MLLLLSIPDEHESVDVLTEFSLREGPRMLPEGVEEAKASKGPRAEPTVQDVIVGRQW